MINNMTTEIKRYFAQTSGVKIAMSCDGFTCKGVMSVSADVKNTLSAIHIHKNINGQAGPITIWLATSPEWENGVVQNTPLANSPCCNNRMCTANAPPGTPLIKNIAGKTIPFEFDFRSNNCKLAKCDFLENFDKSFLNVHGKKFQQVINGCPTKDKPGLDTTGSVMLKQLKTLKQ